MRLYQRVTYLQSEYEVIDISNQGYLLKNLDGKMGNTFVKKENEKYIKKDDGVKYAAKKWHKDP